MSSLKKKSEISAFAEIEVKQIGWILQPTFV